MKKLFLYAFLGLLWCNISFAGIEKKEEVPPFAFTADDKVNDVVEGELISTNKSIDIKMDGYWNQPLTKLDYVLMQLKQKADEKSKQVLKRRTLKQYFEKYENIKKHQMFAGKYKDFQIDNSVGFNEETGKIIVHFSIDGVGKAKNPMSEICKDLLKYVIIQYPLPDQKIGRWNYHNALLNELYRGDDYKNYTKPLEKIANNLVYALSITSEVSLSETKKDDDVFHMSCWKLSDEDKYIFRKWSQSYRETE